MLWSVVDYILVSPALVTRWIPLLEQSLFPLSLISFSLLLGLTYLLDMDGLVEDWWWIWLDSVRSGGK